MKTYNWVKTWYFNDWFCVSKNTISIFKNLTHIFLQQTLKLDFHVQESGIIPLDIWLLHLINVRSKILIISLEIEIPSHFSQFTSMKTSQITHCRTADYTICISMCSCKIECLFQWLCALSEIMTFSHKW